jgi:hypothetical protein
MTEEQAVAKASFRDEKAWVTTVSRLEAARSV